MDTITNDLIVIRTDKSKLTRVAVAYALLAALMVALGISASSNTVILAISFVLAAAFVVGIVHTVRQMSETRELLRADEEGVTDLTKPDDVVFLPWSQIMRIELKAANSNDLMLDVMGYKTLDQLPELKDEYTAQIKQTGGKAYFLLELSGLQLSRSHIMAAFDGLRTMAAVHNPSIAVIEYQDPLTKNDPLNKRYLKKREEDARHAAEAALDELGIEEQPGKEGEK